MSDSEDIDKKEARQQRRDRMMAIPALYIDSSMITTWSDGIRITLGEYMGGSVYYRTAIVMSLDEAEEMGKKILQYIKEERKSAKEDNQPEPEE